MLRLNESSHRRLNPLTGEWVLVSPHRTQRPWQGQIDSTTSTHQVAYDPTCYLCPGNERAGGVRNPQYSSTFAFDNDFPALRPDAMADPIDVSNLIVARAERGICRVACFSPRHDLTLPAMALSELDNVIAMWADQYRDLGSKDFIKYVQIFENRGAMMGASNPHPHCQIWGTGSLPNEPAKEQTSLRNYLQNHQKCLLCEYVRFEVSAEERTIFRNQSFTAMVPFWAVWPFETLIISERHVPDITCLEATERHALAEVLHNVTGCYDRLFQTPFPYSMGFHQQPTDGEKHSEWHLHAHFYPPLLRSATIRKHMVGFEMLGTPQRDITPELAAQRLREICRSSNL
jgi:UDPglucose--hexose-1-phosphate uridylyltransferase